MSKVEITRYQHRLEKLFDKVAAYAGEAELQAHWARYLCVLVSGYLEQSIRVIYIEYTKTKAAPDVANFVEGQLKGFHNPKMEKILELSRSFSPRWEEKLRSATEGELKDAVDSIVANRHRIAHGEDVGITYARIEDYYKKAIKVVQLVGKQCGT